MILSANMTAEPPGAYESHTVAVSKYERGFRDWQALQAKSGKRIKRL